MKQRALFRLGLIAGTALIGFTGWVPAERVLAQQTGSVDVSGYPPEVQKQYRLFADKCSRCHDLSRPLAAKYTTEAQWRDLVSRMARRPGAGISRRDQDQITAFLVFHQKARANTPSRPATSGTVAPTAGAAGEVIPASPAVRAEGATAGGGLRVEVEAMPAQSIVTPMDGRWTTEAPRAGENLFLSVRLIDEATGEKVPYATIRARVGADAASTKPLRPLFGGKGFQYGGNFTAPAGGDLEVSLEVEPPALPRVSDDGHRWTSPLNLKLTLRSR